MSSSNLFYVLINVAFWMYSIEESYNILYNTWMIKQKPYFFFNFLKPKEKT